MLMAVQDGANVQGWIPHPQGTRGSTLQKAPIPETFNSLYGSQNKIKRQSGCLKR